MIMRLIIAFVFIIVSTVDVLANDKFGNAVEPHFADNIFKGKVTGVIDGYTLEIDNKTVKLALIEGIEGNDTQTLNEATHFTSMLCPIRSPALVYHDNYYHGEKLNNASILSAVVYCLASNNYNDTSTIKSVNESLLDAKLALMERDSSDKSSYSN